MQRTQQQQSEQASRTRLVEAIEDAGGKVISDGKVQCPFHDDKHPSATIRQGQDGIWRFYCHAGGCDFGCKDGKRVGGDVFDVRARAQGCPVENVLKEARGIPAGSSGQTVKTNSPGVVKIQKVAVSPAAISHMENSGKDEYQSEVRYPTLDALVKTLPDVELVSAVQDEHGDSLYYEIRYYPDGPGTKKSILRAMPYDDSFIRRGPSPPYYPFNVPELLRANLVVVVEGPNKMEALRRFGIVATSPYGGAGEGKAKHTHWYFLRGKDRVVTFWPDNDPAGLSFMRDVAELVWNMYPRPHLSWIDPASLSLGPKEDVINYLARWPADQQHERILAALNAARPWTSTVASAAAGVKQNTLDIIEGKLADAGLPWKQLQVLSRFVMPGLLSLLVAPPGQLKSWFIDHSIIYWFDRDIPFAYYGLEEDKTYTLERVEAIREKNSDLLDEDFVRRHPEIKLAADERQEPYLNAIGQSIWEAPTEQKTLNDIAQWILDRAKEGRRVVIVDPITATLAVRDCYLADREFVNAAKTVARLYRCTVIIATHTKGGIQGRRLDGIAGGMAYPQLCQACLWLERHDSSQQVSIIRPATIEERFAEPENKTVTFSTEIDLTVHIQKARKAKGPGKSLGYRIDWRTIEFAEQGIIIKEDLKKSQSLQKSKRE